MPRNPDKKRCTWPGCRAWARRGGDFCAAHEDRVVAAASPEVERERVSTAELLPVRAADVLGSMVAMLALLVEEARAGLIDRVAGGDLDALGVLDGWATMTVRVARVAALDRGGDMLEDLLDALGDSEEAT